MEHGFKLFFYSFILEIFVSNPVQNILIIPLHIVKSS